MAPTAARWRAASLGSGRPQLVAVRAAQSRRVLAVRAEPAASTSTLAPPAPAAASAPTVVKWKAAGASITSLAVLQDAAGVKQLLTASLDKTLATWNLEGSDAEDGPAFGVSAAEVAEVPGGPVFSLHPAMKPQVADGKVRPRPVMYCGLAAKEVAAWQPDLLCFNEQVRLNGHTGWVRSLASAGKYLFSCGCNHLSTWDQSYAVPKHVSSTKLFTGDILSLAAAGGRVFTAGADGSLRGWAVGKKGELCEEAAREKAHDGRITSLATHGSLVFSAGYDGSIKAWDQATLKLVMTVKAAHNGERVQALVVAPSSSSSSSNGASSNGSGASTSSNGNGASAGSHAPASAGAASALGDVCGSGALGTPLPSPVTLLYSGGDDGLVRRWDARLLSPVGEPLPAVHNAAVKALAVGGSDLLISGDGEGEVAVWLV